MARIFQTESIELPVISALDLRKNQKAQVWDWPKFSRRLRLFIYHGIFSG